MRGLIELHEAIINIYQDGISRVVFANGVRVCIDYDHEEHMIMMNYDGNKAVHTFYLFTDHVKETILEQLNYAKKKIPQRIV